MFTDIVGYTALTQSDETLALRLLEEHRNLLRPIFQEHGGREVKTIGDSFLVEFSSVLEAARCAVKIQERLHERNGSVPPERTIRLRIGLHLGDLVHSKGDVYGDAVNIASRIEPLAEPSGICASEQVYDQIRNKLGLEISSIGRRELKNVQEPVEVYKIELPWEKEEEMNPKPEGNRIAVLPFVNISPDKGDEYFSDGLTEELISTISNISELSVISRTSIMSYRGSAKKVSEIGRELGVGNVLEGSVRKAGDRIRVSVQLIDVKSDRHLWVQNYDRKLDDVFAVQTDIAGQVADALRIRILPNERQQLEKRPTKSTEAYTLYLKGRYHWNRRSKENLLKAIEYFKLATEADPDFAAAYSGMADSYGVLADHGHMAAREVLPKGMDLSEKAVQLDDTSAEAHTSLAGFAYCWERDWAKGEREFRRAIELNPSYATAHHWYSVMLLRQRRLEEALSEAKKAQQLDPLSPQIHSFCGLVYSVMGRHELAEELGRRAMEIDLQFVPGHINLAYIYTVAKKYPDAEREAQLLLDLQKSPPAKLGVAAVKAFSGKRDEARVILDELSRLPTKDYLPPILLAMAYAGLGENEKLIQMIEKAYNEREFWFYELNVDPLCESIRSDARVAAIMKKVGL